MLPVEQPFKTYTGLDGKPLENGFVYFGRPNENPITAPTTVYWDAAGTIPAAQPLRTVGGYIMRAGTPANLFFDGAYSQLVQDSKGRQVFYARTSADFSITTAIANFLRDLATGVGSALLGFVQAGTGAVERTVEDELRERVSITQFGCIGDNQTDNTAALERVAAYMRTFVGNARMPKVVVPVGVYRYATSPNWGIQGMTMEAQGGAVFKHTGAGNAFICDGGATGAGISRVQVRGNLRVVGNASSRHAIYIRAVHHSFFEMSGRDVPQAILATFFTVCNEYRVKCTPTFEPGFSVVPSIGILADKRDLSEQTSACTYYNPIMEGISGYGIVLASAVQNTIIGGTSEGNGGGISVSAESEWNNIVGLDMEANSIDVNCLGSKNTFENCLATTNLIINGTRNRVIGGTYNAINVAGPRNMLADLDYSNAGGLLIDTGVNTITRNLYNLTAAMAQADFTPTAQKLLTIDGPVGSHTLIGSDDQIGGGSANDLSLFHFGPGIVKLWAGAQVKIQYSGTGIGFNGANPIAKPTIVGSRQGNPAVASMASALAALGLVTDGTTA